MMSWPVEKLDDHIEVLTDYHANGSYKVLKENVELLDDPDYAVMIRTTNFEKEDFSEDLKYINQHAYEFLKKSRVFGGDILMNKIANAGSVYLMPELNRPVSLAMNLFLIRISSERLDQTFAYYYLKANEGYIKSFATGSTTTTITKKAVRNLEIVLPPIDTQRKTVDTIYAYQALIENNKRRIKLLEESARQLYKEWFVRFRFPGHEHVRIIDGVPEGWNKEPISILCSFLGRGMTPTYDDEGIYTVINQKCIRNRLLSLGLVRRQSKDFSEEKLVKYGDVLINSTGTGTLGRVAQCWIHLANCTIDTHVTIARPKEDVHIFWFGYCLLELEPIFEGMGEGATNQKELKRDLVGALKVLLPPKILRQEFDDFVFPLIAQISNLVDQNRSLVSARDILLPKLMSGEIAV